MHGGTHLEYARRRSVLSPLRTPPGAKATERRARATSVLLRGRSRPHRRLGFGSKASAQLAETGKLQEFRGFQECCFLLLILGGGSDLLQFGDGVAASVLHRGFESGLADRLGGVG